MPKIAIPNPVLCGVKLAALRKAAGYTQIELAHKVGISQRVIAYYEGETQHPPTNLLPRWAAALDVSTDELLGLKSIKKDPKIDNRLQRRLRQIERMYASNKRRTIQLLDAFIEREQHQQQAK